MTYQLQSNTITFEAALRDLGSSSLKVRVNAARALGDVTDPADRAQAAAALIKALHDDHGQVRSEAALSLGDLELELSVEPLTGRLGDMVPLVRQSAAIALGRLGFASGFDALKDALAEGAPDLRFQAATSLVEVDSERAYEPLLTALQDEDSEVLGAAALALGAIGNEQAAPHLVPLLTHERIETRFDVAYALTQLGHDTGVSVLAECALHKDLGWDAIEALELAGTPDAADALVPVMAAQRLPPQFPLRAAAALLAIDPAHSGAETARAVLKTGLTSRKQDLRGLTVQLLDTVGGSWAVEPLTALRARRAGRKLASEIDTALAGIEGRASE